MRAAVAAAGMATVLMGLAGCQPDDVSLWSRVSGASLRSLSVTGSYEALSDGTIRIDPTVSWGKFVINWEVDSYESYDVNAYFSDNPYLDDLDYWFTSTTCGTVYDGCITTGSRTCWWNSDNTIDCLYEYDITSLTNFIASGIPKDGYIVVEVCDTQNACSESSVKIQLL